MTKANESTKAVVVVIIIIVLAAIAYYSISQPQAAVTTTATTVAPSNYSSFNSVSTHGISALLSSNDISVEYSMSTNYPFYGNKTRRILASKIIIYNKSGSNEEEVVMPRQINEVLQYFLINGKDYMCSAFTNRTNATEQCSSLGNTYPAFLDFNNQTFITNANGMLLGFTSQLKFTDQVTVNAVYQGYNATYVHANLTDPANSGIHGNVSVYMSRDNGVPLS